MKKIIFLEGLPGVGKTTIINYLKNNYSTIDTVCEIVNEKIFNNINGSQLLYIENDLQKLEKINSSKRLIVIDRGPISTLSYNQLNSKLNKLSIKDITSWFKNVKKIYNDINCKVIYLINNEYYLPYLNELDPYGSIKNQKRLNEITIKNCIKYCKNFQIINYNKENMIEVINEIIS